MLADHVGKSKAKIKLALKSSLAGKAIVAGDAVPSEITARESVENGVTAMRYRHLRNHGPLF
jgi:hypothetical protein